MSDLLCRWLNQDLRLSKTVDPTTIAKDFSTGYLIGEVLHKYELQQDFKMFMKKETAVSKLNNFNRLEPTLQLLGITFDINIAQDVMQEKQGVATHLLYQLYASLEKKKKAEISRTMMEIMQPSAKTGLHKKDYDIYAGRLHQVVKRDAELKLQKISLHYEQRYLQPSNASVVTLSSQARNALRIHNEMRAETKARLYRVRQGGIAPLSQPNTVRLPQPPPYATQFNRKKRRQQQQHPPQQQRKQKQAQTVESEIADFETIRKNLASTDVAAASDFQPTAGNILINGSSTGGVGKLVLQCNKRYIQEIRERLEENTAAREQREKRRDRFLVEQLKAHEAQEDARRDEQLVSRLTRQTQQEQRLASQLLLIRKQKDVILQNRLFREQQYQQRRKKDFQEALEREAALAQQVKLERAEEIKKEQAFFEKITAELTQKRYKKHFKTCKDILWQIVDLATKIGEYRLITANLIPAKMMREWKELLFTGLPLYESTMSQEPDYTMSLDPLEMRKLEILNNQDYDEYTSMVGEWGWPEEAGESKPPPGNNDILGHIMGQLKNTVHPPVIEAVTCTFPPFKLKACVLGKFCSGKTTCLNRISEALGITVLSPDKLIEDVLNARHSEEQNSPRVVQGMAAAKELRQGNPIPSELMVDIIVEAINRLPPHSGWVLDGFPVDITQARLLEEALGGSLHEMDVEQDSRKHLSLDPDPPKPPPPPDPVLDVVLLLDISDENVTTRAFTHSDTKSPPTDLNVYLAQIPHRLAAFLETWPKLDKWYGGRQNILAHINATVTEDELHKKVMASLRKIMRKMPDPSDTPDVEVGATGEASPTPDNDESVDLTLALTEEVPAPESTSSPNKEKTSPESPPKVGDLTASETTVREEGKESPLNQLETASPLPVGPGWSFVDHPLPLEISAYLATHWEMVCDSYVSNLKTVMQQLRAQNMFINHQLYSIREEFKYYLQRPDVKQGFVSQWQADFNNVSDDMKDDEETKAEQHMRLTELCGRLWDISYKRKEMDEQERDAIMTSGWLEEHTAVIINLHSELMQEEIDRFQETLSILRIYYSNVCKKVVPDPPTEFICLSLLVIPDSKDQEDSTETGEVSVCSQQSDAEEKRKAKVGSKRTDSVDAGTKTPSQDQPVLVKPTIEKLISNYEEAVEAISNMVAAEDQQVETKEPKESEAENSSNTAKKGKSPKKKGTEPAVSSPLSSPATGEDKKGDKSHDISIRNKIHKEYAAAVKHELKSAKVRMTLVKGHGLEMIHRLNSRAERASSNMLSWLQAHFLSEMESMEQLAEVVRHHIESGDKLVNQLELESTDFCLNGDCRTLASPVPPPRPPAVENTTEFVPTVAQLESLRHQLYRACPSGLMASCSFTTLLRDVTSVHMGRDIFPEAWINTNEKHELCDVVDWRQFLLNVALPWPFPSLSQLLDLLKLFKAADPMKTGFISMEDYLQTGLWFSDDSDQPIPEDPFEPLPYDRLANLRKFFFQLFANHLVSPPQLDYMCMLRGFAADPDHRRGFFRALSVELGQPVKQHSTPDPLVKSLPSIEEAAEPGPTEQDGGENAESVPTVEPDMSISDLLPIICHKVTQTGTGPSLQCPNWERQKQNLSLLFRQLGYTAYSRVPFSVLIQHHSMQKLIETTTHHQLKDFQHLPQTSNGAPSGCATTG